MRPVASTPLDDYAEVEKYARLILKKADVGDRLPTPVVDIIDCAELVVDGTISLHEVDKGFFKKFRDIAAPGISRVLSKLRGMLDVRDKVIYLDLSVVPGRKAFVQLHEVGHKVLPWQQDILLRLDDDLTLAPEVRDAYERQANHFASSTLFQLDRFDREAKDLPLEMKSAMVLARRYGASNHAATRRFVERNHRACALLALEKLDAPDPTTGRLYRVKTVVESRRFYERCGEVDWPEFPPNMHPVMQAIFRRRKFFEDELSVTLPNGKPMDCRFHFFNNGYTPLALIHPADEKAHTRTRIVLAAK